MGKLVIITAPSGSGKTTVARHLLAHFPQLYFSISATTRAPRAHEQHGRDYFFVTEEQFRRMIEQQEFLEWEEVYPGTWYGSLQSELFKGWHQGKAVLYDIDVFGAQRLKEKFGSAALTLFIRPPSVATLKERLLSRGTESAEQVERRLSKAVRELQLESVFDHVVVNEDLAQTLNHATDLVHQFLSNNSC
ncbi:MAG: guanylate kinase [Chitinophagales bacterium]|nr:guanylate kinase [Chitinophagales bacterium]MDW8428690.1 guanylate kinase [Chitinophagales bacterium]